MKYTKDAFVAKLKEITSDPFEIKEYDGTSKPGVFYCGLCKKDYHLTKMGNLLKREKHICAHCFASQYAEKALDEIKTKENLSFISFGYKENLHKPTIIYSCNSCNEVSEKPLVEFLKYPTCIHCGPNAKRRTNNSVALVLPEGFSLIGEYKGQFEKTLIRHSCGFIFSVRPKDIISGHSFCPKCSKKASKGERRIIDFLEKNFIEFEKEKVFAWSDKKRYDFFLPHYNLLIEYHGIQHYKEVPNFFLSLEKQQEIDSWKEKIATKHGYDYLIISYENFELIEEILAQRLKEST